MATRCESEYNLATDETVIGLRCVHDAGHEFDHLFMVRWESGDPSDAERQRVYESMRRVDDELEHQDHNEQEQR